MGDLVGGTADGVAQVGRLLLEGEAAVLDPRQGEEVLDEVQQPLAVAVDPLDELVLLLGEVHGVVVGEELGVADDAGQRRPQLVADRRDELALGAVEVEHPLVGLPLLVQGEDQRLLGGTTVGHVAYDAEVAQWRFPRRRARR